MERRDRMKYFRALLTVFMLVCVMGGCAVRTNGADAARTQDLQSQLEEALENQAALQERYDAVHAELEDTLQSKAELQERYDVIHAELEEMRKSKMELQERYEILADSLYHMQEPGTGALESAAAAD